jgi:hypothetical protein
MKTCFCHLAVYCILTSFLCATPAPTAMPQDRIRIFYQGEEFANIAGRISQKLKAEGFNTSTAPSALRQFPRWANTIRFFHAEDRETAVKVFKLAAEISQGNPNIAVIDLTQDFKDAKVPVRSIEIWICDVKKNNAMAPEAYEEKLKSSKAMPMSPGAPLIAASIPALPVNSKPVDPKDPYCTNWSLADRKAFLNKQKGESYQNKMGGQDKAEFVFYYSHAVHGHGAPEGSCGIRVVVYKKDDQGKRVKTGSWENLDLSRLYLATAGDHHCFISATGDMTDEKLTGAYIIDEKGHVLWQSKWDDPEMAVWIEKSGKEQLWMTKWQDIVMVDSDGKTLWTRKGGEHDSYLTFISADHRFAFHLYENPPQKGIIYDQDGNTVCSYIMPFESEKAQKALLGLNEKGELVIRVDRRIYSISDKGTPLLEAMLPLYKGRHRSVEIERSGIHFDVGFEFGAINHQYDYATNIERSYDHPRPVIKFNINDFKAEESMDEGKHWHAIDIRMTGTLETK